MSKAEVTAKDLQSAADAERAKADEAAERAKQLESALLEQMARSEGAAAELQAAVNAERTRAEKAEQVVQAVEAKLASEVSDLQVRVWLHSPLLLAALGEVHQYVEEAPALLSSLPSLLG